MALLQWKAFFISIRFFSPAVHSINQIPLKSRLQETEIADDYCAIRNETQRRE